MKRTKTLIVAILCLTLVLTSALLVVAACGEEGYSITVSSYDDQQGTVTYTQPQKGELYDPDETVTITVTPKDGYEVVSVLAGDTALTANADA